MLLRARAATDLVFSQFLNRISLEKQREIETWIESSSRLGGDSIQISSWVSPGGLGGCSHPCTQVNIRGKAVYASFHDLDGIQAFLRKEGFKTSMDIDMDRVQLTVEW